MSEEVKEKAKRRKTGLFVVFGGIATLIAGYVLLGQGSMTAAPVLILGSFVILAIGIMLGWD